MAMTKEMLMDIQVKAISALMAKLGVSEITLNDDDVKAVQTFLGSNGTDYDEVEMSYNYKPEIGLLTLKMSIPE